MALYRSSDVVHRMMTIRSGGVLTDADSGMTATLYVDGSSTSTTVTITNLSTGEYRLSYTVPTGLTDGAELAMKVVGAVSGTGFTQWFNDQYSTILCSLDYSCIADWVLRQPVADAETSTCTNIPVASANSLLYMVKNIAPSSSWFTTIVSSASSCGCGSSYCKTCSCY